jgi:hypothetical protein
MAVAVIISPQPRDNNNGDPVSYVRAIRSPLARGVRRRGPDTARRCIKLDNRDRLQHHTRTPTTRMNQTKEGIGYYAGQPSELSPLVDVAAAAILVVVVGRRRIHFDWRFSPLTQMVTTPVTVGLGRGSPNYRLTNTHFFSNRKLLGSGDLLCCCRWVSLVPRTDYSVERAANISNVVFVDVVVVVNVVVIIVVVVVVAVVVVVVIKV